MKTKSSVALSLTSLAIASSASAAIISGVAGGNNSWNDPANWDTGVPTGTDNAVIAAGVLAQANDASTPSYSGTTTISSGATLRIINGQAASANAIGTGGLIMEAGSTMDTPTSTNITFPTVTLNGAADFVSSQNPADRDSKIFGNGLVGSGDLTVTGRNVEQWVFNGSSASYTGNITFAANDRYIVRANTTGVFGTANITVTPRGDGRSAILDINANDVFADSAILTLDGFGGNSTGGFEEFSGSPAIINMDADDTVSGLIVNGVTQAPGTYTGIDAPWISGTGTLTVIPEPSSMILVSLAGLGLFARRRRS